MSRAGLTKKAVQHAWENDITVEELSKSTGKSILALRCCATRLKLRLKSSLNKRAGWGSLKEKIIALDTHNYIAKDVAEKIGTTIFSVYSLCARHNKILKKADYGSQKSVKYSKTTRKFINKNKL